MAATSLWHIKGRLKDLIDYVENPAKTVASDDLKDFFVVFSYVRNPEKTDNGEYVSAVNCLKETALEQMILTKKQYQKSGGYIAWHGYQSFRPNEVTPEQLSLIHICPNGAGKSTTMKMFLGLTKPTSGSFTIDGKKYPEARVEILKEVGSFIEAPAFYGNLSGEETVSYTHLDVYKRQLPFRLRY